MLLSSKCVVQPVVEPVTLAQLKQHLRIDSGYTDDDALLGSLITAARQYAEDYTHRAFFNQTWTRWMDHFPTNYNTSATVNPSMRRDWPYYDGLYWNSTIALPTPVVQSIVSIAYTDNNGNTQSYSLSAINVDYNSEPCRLKPANDGVWPFTQFNAPGSVAITYITGSYGDGVEVNNCPQGICQAILLLCGQWYEHKEATSVGNLFEIPFGVKALLDMFTFHVFDYDSVV